MLSFVALLLPALAARAQDETTTTTAPPQPPPVQETVVHGTFPDLTGRWFALVALELPDGQGNTLPAFWEISTRDGKLEMNHRAVDPPAAQKAAIDAAGAEGKAWTPTPEDLAAIAAAWDDLRPVVSHLKSVKNDIAGKDGFDDNLKKDPRTKDAVFVIRQRMDLFPTAAPVVRYAFVYAAMAAKDDGYTGNLDGVTIAAAPFPLPISVKGSLRMYRIPGGKPPEPQGFFARLLDQLRGCGRK